MNRREFFKSLAVITGTLALDPEELLWRPTKTIFIPSANVATTWDAMNERLLLQYMPRLIDNLYKKSPVYLRIRRKEEQLYESTQINWPVRQMVQEPMQGIQDAMVRQVGNSIRELQEGMGLRSGAPEIHGKPQLHSIYARAMHRAATEGAAGLVLPMPGAPTVS